ncbi:MAG: A/G-specific adenine glycosylase [Anaerolineae bacterium]|nr:A/G-specific adenine glycosylase [Anaerolineae bacterium]MCA9892837.1 A/G-specific adenine glycosylase [Anaerolineae bacterium]
MTDSIAQRLLDWYDEHAADLPWRANKDPYRIWLSEIMLQQTQIDTVIPYYTRFLDAYPTVAALAHASLDEVLKKWEGLGYYSRARNLHRAAQQVADELDGQFPATAAELQSLPGIGPYTAGAVASIAYDESVPVLDGNVIRVLTRLEGIRDDVTLNTTRSDLWALAAEWVPQQRAGDYNQALMELGQTICKPRNPECTRCPLNDRCLAFANGEQEHYPVKKKKAPTPHFDVAAGIIYNDQQQILIAQRPLDGLLGGLWEFPGGKQEADETLPQTLSRELREELAIEVRVGELFVQVKHAFTHFRITLHAYECQYLGPMPPYDVPQLLGANAFAWVTRDQFAKYSFGKADRMVIEALNRRKNMLL